MATYKWQFATRFRRGAFGWKGSLQAIQRLKEALAEIKLIARKEPVLAADGAVTLLRKLSPAFEQIDESTGALNNAIYHAFDVLVPIISRADVDARVRAKWLDALWQAFNDDQIPWIEGLGDYWGELCGTPEIASQWADTLMPSVLSVMTSGNNATFSLDIVPCLSCLYSAERYLEILTLLENDADPFWHYRKWGVQAYVALGETEKAIAYAEADKERDRLSPASVEVCEDILLSAGRVDEAYTCYALTANRGTSYLATFRAITKKYPHKPKAEILHDLIASKPGEEGKWFAAAKDAGLFDLALELIERSPTDPKTLIRACRDYAQKQPAFALAAGLWSLRWMSRGYGFELTALDALYAYEALKQVLPYAGVTLADINAQIREMIAAIPDPINIVRTYLEHQVNSSAFNRQPPVTG